MKNHKKTGRFHSFLITIIFAMLFVLRFGLVSTVQAEANPMEDLFKDFDFDSFLKDMDQALKEIKSEEEKKEALQPGSGQKQNDKLMPPTEKSQKEHALSKQESGKPVSATSITQPEKKDPESLFLDPAIETLTSERDKKIQKPTSQSIAAYQQIMGNFIHHLASLEKKISSMPQFSPEFQEAFASRCYSTIDRINVASNQIGSKKLYQIIFLAPPEENKKLVEDMKKLRKAILDASKELKKIDDQIIFKPEEEEKEDTEEVLRKLAGKNEPAQKPKQKETTETEAGDLS